MAQKVTILGAGNGGQTTAYHLSSHGIDVMLWEHPDFAGHLDAVKASGGIEAVETFVHGGREIHGAASGFARIAGVTTDMAEALDHADVLLMIVPAFAQETIFKLASPLLRDEHLLAVLPGNYASLVFARMMREAGAARGPLLAEMPSIPYACRIVGPGKVFILGMKEAFELAAFPGTRTAEAVERLTGLLPLRLDPLANVLEAGFMNMNMIVHPSTATLSMGAFESREGKFLFYKEGMSDSTSKVQATIDAERLAIGAKLGLNLLSFLEAIRIWYGIDVDSIRQFAVETPIHNVFGDDAPKSPRERYITEDTPYTLVPMHEFGALAGVAHAAIESIIHIDNIYNDTNYYETGRTLAKMGLAGMGVPAMLRYVSEG